MPIHYVTKPLVTTVNNYWNSRDPRFWRVPGSHAWTRCCCCAWTLAARASPRRLPALLRALRSESRKETRGSKLNSILLSFAAFCGSFFLSCCSCSSMSLNERERRIWCFESRRLVVLLSFMIMHKKMPGYSASVLNIDDAVLRGA
jgi:hypothetical protein